MSHHTTLRVGGPCDLFVEIEDKKKLIDVYKCALNNEIPVFILGGGSNILVGDKGIRGLVIKNKVSGYKLKQKTEISKDLKNVAKARRSDILWRPGLLNWVEDYKETTNKGVILSVSSGMPLAGFISQTLEQGFTGLQWFVRIPGTLGGAVWNNIHGAEWHLGDYLLNVEFIDEKGNLQNLKKEELNLKYNDTYFRNKKSLILEADIFLFLGDKHKALQTASEWREKKSIQPTNSAGSTFSNISFDEKEKYQLESGAAGFIIDKVLNLRGYNVGKTKISERHTNFIETQNGSKASDVVEIIELVKARAKEKIGLELKEEIVRVGEF